GEDHSASYARLSDFISPLARPLLFAAYSPLPLPALFFFNHPATPAIYTLSLHDALPIYGLEEAGGARYLALELIEGETLDARLRSEEHTSELQSLTNLVCRLLLEKKKNHGVSSCREQRSECLLATTEA